MSELQELLERFRRGPELLSVAMTGAAGAELDWPAGPGKWSLRQIVCHVADGEIVGVDRFRRTLAEENPTLVAYDQDAWASKLDYGRRKVTQALETFRRIRGENYELLKEAGDAAFARQATHSVRGPVSLMDLLRIYTEHAEKHAEQIRALRAEFQKQRV